MIFIFLLLGSLFGFYIYTKFVGCLIVALIIFVGSLVVAIVNKKASNFLIPIICFVIGFCCYSVAIDNFNKGQDKILPTTVSARIYNVGLTDGKTLSLCVDSLKFDGRKVDGRARLYIVDYQNRFDDFSIGTTIDFEPYSVDLVNLLVGDIPSAYYYKNDFKYQIYTGYSLVNITGNDKTFAEKLQLKIKENLSNGLSNENVEIAYAAMFGDKSLMPSEQYSNYQLSGVAHILAVSGLHVSIIVGVLYAFFKLIHVKGWWRFAILTAFLLFYMYLCSYSVSVVRASIMSIIMLLAPLIGRRYDTLSALSVAGIVIFCTNPLCVYDVGFLMSFSCVLGIAFMFKPIASAISKTHLPKWLGDSVAISTATMVSVLIVMAYFFGRINIVSVFANILILPMFSLAFSIVFVLGFLSLIAPFITYMLLPLNFLFNIINSMTFVIANLKYVNYNTANLNYYVCLIYFFLLMILGRICTAKRGEKVVTSLTIVALLMACLV